MSSTKTSGDLWSYVHTNKRWVFTTPKGYHNGPPVTATVVLTDVHESGSAGTWLRGKAVDEYGWWHTGVVVGADAVGTLVATCEHTAPDAAPFPVTVGFDQRHGFVRLLVPDDVARRLSVWCRAHWHEFYGFNDGYSDSPRRGSWEHRALAYLHSVQCHLTDDMPFIEGVSYQSLRDQHVSSPELLASTCGVRPGVFPTVGFHFSG